MAKQYFTAVIASGAATSNTLDLGTDQFKRVYIDNKAGGEISLLGSGDGSTFGLIKRFVQSAGCSVVSTYIIGSAHSATWVGIDGDLPRYVRVLATGAAANGASVGIITV